MASVSDIATVRRNINEPGIDPYSDLVIGTMIDASGVAGATAEIWREKAARYSELVNVSESGASHAYSDLHKNALAMAGAWDKQAIALNPPVLDRVRVSKIVRS